MRLPSRSIVAGIAALAVATLAACTSQPDVATSSTPPPATVKPAAAETALESILRIARENGASPDQLAVLTLAASADAVTFEQVRAAVDATYACLDAADIPYIEEPIDIAEPLPLIRYSIGVPTPESDLVSDDCVYTHSFFVESAYQNQPAAVNAKEAAFTRQRTHFIACLSEAGYPVDEAATNDEIKNFIVIALTGSGIGSAAEPPPDFVSTDCLSGTGIDGF